MIYLEKILGKGRYSQVFRIKMKKANVYHAAKISLRRISKKISQNILSEIEIMKSLEHSSIIKFIGYSQLDFENNPNPTIIIEYAPNGSLQNIIDNSSEIKWWNETKRLIIIFGIVAGMCYMHKQLILHNDLKPSNILLDENFNPKIADFGLSHKKTTEEDHLKGTPSYIAPEIIEKNEYSE